ncbi:MAG: Stk1 family PASTA domain-containing Ser/Thr kinase, partial [Clostridia bacterium]|nr:Stk1 family PASTA domain-containing Ser/Thr kinase [Clostridia bacterium]
MIGRLISGRYRIEALVGMGGTAKVYRAMDEQENRTVAIKVLRAEYESDMEFVRRFSREAEAAAKMAHENIVNLLDVGIEGEMRYIVMEYVAGRTLKDMICEEGRIHPDIALRMTIRILAAVDHAHRNGIVHRDIKPQNILVDAEGRIKVADFGIARLKAAQTTNVDNDGSAMGSVHYLSPEQAKGEITDEQSDLYSVGIVMYEMLTGKVPFDGDTAIAVALKHVNEAPVSMRSHDAHISRAMDEVVTRALCKDKKRRYQTAAEMAADLRLTISRPRGGFVRYPKVEKVKEEVGAEVQREEKKKPARKSKKRGVEAAIIIVAVVVLACAAVTFLYFHNQHKNTVYMPLLIGQSESDAVEKMHEIGVDPTIVNAYSEEYQAGLVMLQSRQEGETLKKDATLTLTVSLGSQWYYLEDMSGWDSASAISALVDSGVKNIEVSYTHSDLPVGTVVSLDLPEGWTSRDTAVTVSISGQSVSMPSLSGLTLNGAQAVIEAEGLKIGSVTEGESADAPSGTVIAQSIAPYTRVLVGASVDLTIC